MFTFFDTTGKLMKGKVVVLVDLYTYSSEFIAYEVFENGKYLYNSAEPLEHIRLWADNVNIIDKRVK
jgi:hypothetical protein